MNLLIKETKKLEGDIVVPGDKSISHRAIMLGALAEGTTEVKGFLMGEDCLSTIDCFRNLGIQIDIMRDKVLIKGKGLGGLQEPEDILNVGNSALLLAGLYCDGWTEITAVSYTHLRRRRWPLTS